MEDTLSRTFSALADPTRRAILARLSQGEATVNELAAPHAMSLPAISRHLRVLENAGLVSQARSARWRPRKLETAPLKDADEWMSRYRQFFDERFDRLDAQLRSAAEALATESNHGDDGRAGVATSTEGNTTHD